jgi:hypothetical protein
MAAALIWLPAFAAGQQSQTAQPQAGQACNEGQPCQQMAGSLGPTQGQGVRGGGRTRSGWASRLSHDQVRELQQAMKDMGCDPGPVDGMAGARTNRAVACARQQKGISGNDVNDLFRALNLGFAAADSSGTGGGGGQANTGNMGNVQGMTNPATQAVHGQQHQVAGENRGRIRPTAGSAGTGVSPTAEPARAAQRGRGMHDSTTSRPGDTTTRRPPM